MIKLTKYSSYKSLKVDSRSIKKTDENTIKQMKEWEEFLNVLQEKLLRNRTIENSNL